MMINSSKYCSDDCILSKIGDELPPLLVIDGKECLECANYVCEINHTKCFNCFNDDDTDEYFYFHTKCLKPPKLTGSRYYHDGACLPNKDTCQSGCWRYWCSDCNFGISGMYSACPNKNCKRHYQIFTNKGIKCLLCEREDIYDECNCFEKL
jgi:hypothetical protein